MINIFCGNLSWSLTEDELRAVFEPFGEVLAVRIPGDPEKGRSRGFGFVEMASDDAAAKAMAALAGTMLKGRNIQVNQARPRRRRDESR